MSRDPAGAYILHMRCSPTKYGGQNKWEKCCWVVTSFFDKVSWSKPQKVFGTGARQSRKMVKKKVKGSKRTKKHGKDSRNVFKSVNGVSRLEFVNFRFFTVIKTVFSWECLLRFSRRLRN